MPLAVETHQLVKTFGSTRAIDGLDLSIEPGTVYGLLGPNGAGKTTTIRVVSTLLRPTSGTVRVLGHDVVTDAAEVRAQVGMTGQFASIDDEITGRENLVLLSRLNGLPWREAKERASDLLEAFGLAEAGGRLARTFSGGMRRKLDIAASLVVTPKLLILDEPTTGLDLRSRNQVWEIVRAIAAQGTTVLLTTQYLEEADRLSERLAVIDRGRLIAEGTSSELKAKVGSSRLNLQLRRAGQRAEASSVLTRALGVAPTLDADPASITAAVPDEAVAAKALEALAKAKVGIANFSVGQPSMDDVFLAVTGHAANQEED